MAAGRALRTDRAEETRERILSAAERLFAEHGVLLAPSTSRTGRSHTEERA